MEHIDPEDVQDDVDMQYREHEPDYDFEDGIEEDAEDYDAGEGDDE
jgi:hypothetical protein